MKNRSILFLAVAAALATAVATPTLAYSDHHKGPKQTAGQQGNMGPMGGQNRGMGMMGSNRGMGMMGSNGGMDMMRMMHERMGNMGMMGGRHGGMGMMGSALYQSFDTDDDGTVTPDENRAGWLKQLETYDSDGNGTLSIKEFEALHAAAIRTRMVDRFQAFDEDGDGEVTKDEITAPAKRMKHMQMRKARSEGQTGMPMMQDEGTTEDN